MSTRSTISSTIRHLLISRDMKTGELADLLTRNGRRISSAAYMSRKINEERWTVDELDILAKIFELEPADFVRGYQYIKENHELPSH